MHQNLKLELKENCVVVVVYGSVPELGQRGATQDRMRNASSAQIPPLPPLAYLAQLVERKTFNLVVVGSSPTVGTIGFVVKLVITVDFESTVPGSIPGETYFLYSSVGRAPGC